MATLARLAVWVLFALAFVTFVGAAILAGGSGGALEVLLHMVLGVAFVAAAFYLRSNVGWRPTRPRSPAT